MFHFRVHFIELWMEARAIYKPHSSPCVSDLLSAAESHWDLWSDPSSQTDVSSAGAALAWLGRSKHRSLCGCSCLSQTENGPFCHLKMRFSWFSSHGINRDMGQLWCWGLEKSITSPTFGIRFLEWHQLCRTALMLCIWKDFKGKMVKLHICMSSWSVQHCSPRCCHFYFVVL